MNRFDVRRKIEEEGEEMEDKEEMIVVEVVKEEERRDVWLMTRQEFAQLATKHSVGYDINAFMAKWFFFFNSGGK